MTSRNIQSLVLGRVIGDVVDVFSPTVKLSITYNPDKRVGNGYELQPRVISVRPRVEIGGDDMRDAYTLVRT